MLKLIAKLIFRLAGWKVDYNIPEGAERSVVIAAPHTSWWDFVYMRAGFEIIGFPCRYTIKKEFLRFPFKRLMIALGAIAIDRTPKNPGEKRPSMTEAMIDLFDGREELAVAVAAEGSRALRTEWKTGFYYVAKGAGVPITFGYLDFKKKIAGIGGLIHLTDDMDADMRKIMAFYKDITPKFPKHYSIDQRYIPEPISKDK